jgi:hypothetical protein
MLSVLPGKEVEGDKLTLDLGALHVELGTAGGAGAVQSEQLNTHQVLAGGDAGRHVKVVPAVVVDHLIDGPHAVVDAALGDLEPLLASGRGRSGVADLGKVDRDGA